MTTAMPVIEGGAPDRFGTDELIHPYDSVDWSTYARDIGTLRPGRLIHTGGRAR